ncbi:hypothetical protein KSP39_PZI015295 [Platanthera zijinensis]|uniref:Tf2-1-like SH3-like domain-containing protein n=1 Tax=Platanthera zijinensis TaxID=2320716 RepID=A0AAP0B9A1_9ASPA
MDEPRTWTSWLHLAEYCFNTSYHSASKLTPFEVVYGRPPPSLSSYKPGGTAVAAVDRALRDRDRTLATLRENLRTAQDRMKAQADRHRTEREFQVGDEVFLKLCPYRQLPVAQRTNQKLAPRYYGPFRITRRVGPVVYTLALPEGSMIHPTFHVSMLKRKIGDTVEVSPCLPDATTGGELRPIPDNVLLIKWKRRGTAYSHIYTMIAAIAASSFFPVPSSSSSSAASLKDSKTISDGPESLSVRESLPNLHHLLAPCRLRPRPRPFLKSTEQRPG